MHDVIVSTVTLRTDDKKLNEKGMEVNLHLKKLRKEEKNIFLIDNSRKIKAQHVNNSKLHSTNSNANIEECNLKDDVTTKKYDEWNITLKTIRDDNVKKLIFAHLNISSIRNKSEFLITQVKDKINILMISKTKIDKIFPKTNFLIEGFRTTYRFGRDSKGGKIMLCVREDIPSNLIAFEGKPIETIFIELNLQNTKMLINCSYNTHKSRIKKHLTALRNPFDLHSSKYEKILILGNFNVDIEEANMKSFCENYNLKRLIKQPTCYKNRNKPTCIDLTFHACFKVHL